MIRVKIFFFRNLTRKDLPPDFAHEVAAFRIDVLHVEQRYCFFNKHGDLKHDYRFPLDKFEYIREETREYATAAECPHPPEMWQD